MSEQKQPSLNFGTTSASSTFTWPSAKSIRSANFLKTEEGNFIEIISQITSQYQITTSTSTLPLTPVVNMLKEIYGVIDGELVLIKSITGKENQGHYVPPSIEWNE